MDGKFSSLSIGDTVQFNADGSYTLKGAGVVGTLFGSTINSNQFLIGSNNNATFKLALL